MFSKIKKIFISNAFFVIFSLFLSVGMITGSFVYKTRAATMGTNGEYIFGGLIQNIKVCCNGLKVTVGPPNSGTFMFTSGSMLYQWYNLSVGQCVLGDAYIGGICIKPIAWPPCTRIERVDGTIRYVGTTLQGPPSGTCGGTSSSGGSSDTSGNQSSSGSGTTGSGSGSTGFNQNGGVGINQYGGASLPE